MTIQDILALRLINQRLISGNFTTPEEAVAHFTAVQSQDYPGAKWAVGQRMTQSTDALLEQAFTDGKILRTHVMRPTWHFVHPEDAQWMLELTGPRISRAMSSYNKLLDLNDAVFQKAHRAILTLFEKKKAITRTELKAELARIGIPTNTQKLAHIIMEAELRCFLISGPREGKPANNKLGRGSPTGRQFTYMLFSDRVPKTKKRTREEGLKELTKRYFLSHGPAQIQDFAWWSGLTVVDAKRGIELNPELRSEEINGKTYYFSPNLPKNPTIPNSVLLLPNYDEYTIAYKNRSAFYNEKSSINLYASGALIFAHAIIYQGRVIGMWRRNQKAKNMVIEPNFAEKPAGDVMKKIEKAVDEYSEFLEMPVEFKL